MASRPAGVLLLTLNSSLGGTEKSLLELFSRLDSNAYRPCLVTLIGDGTLVRMAQERGLEAIHLNMRGPLDASVVVRLAEVLRGKDISILHTSIYHTGILGRLLGWACAIPVRLCAARSTDDWRTRAHTMLDRVTQGFAHGYIANCEAVAARLRNVEKIAPEKIRVIRTGIESPLPASRDAVENLRARLNIPAGAVVLGTVANLREAKGHAVLVEAAKTIIAKCPKAIFLWVGDGPLRGQLERQIKVSGLGGNFRIAGFQEDVAPYYALFDAFVLPSRWEGLPLAMMEAMSLGIPIVASRVGGVPEILADGKDARLVVPGDAGALAEAVEQMLWDKKAATDMAASAKARFARENSIERCVRETEALYREYLEGSAIPHPTLSRSLHNYCPSPYPLPLGEGCKDRIERVARIGSRGLRGIGLRMSSRA